MEIVLGVSMTTTAVRMLLVGGAKADGLTIDQDSFDITISDESPQLSPADQVTAAVLGTQQNARSGGHELVATGLAWGDGAQCAALRDSLAARGVAGVALVSDFTAAGALTQAVGRAMNYAQTALVLVERDTATLALVTTADGSSVEVISKRLDGGDVQAAILAMASGLEESGLAPDGMFVVGSGVDVSSVKAHLETLVSMPVSAPEDDDLALARGAALAAASTPRFEAATSGLAYSRDPDYGTDDDAVPVDPVAATQSAAAVPGFAVEPNVAPEPLPDAGHQPFLLVGSALCAIFVVGVVALVISLAVNIRPTADQRPAPAESVVSSNPAPPGPPLVQQARPVPPPPAPETIPAPIPVVQEAPRTVFVERPAPPPPAAPAAAPAPPPVVLPPVVVPAPVFAPPPVVFLPRPEIRVPEVRLPPVLRRPSRPRPQQPPATTPPQSPPTAGPVPESPPTVAPVPESPPTVSPVPESPPTVSPVPESPPTVSPVPESLPTASPVPQSPPTASPAPQSPPTASSAPPSGSSGSSGQSGSDGAHSGGSGTGSSGSGGGSHTPLWPED